MALWTQGGFVDDRYARAETLEAAPQDGAVIVPLALWRAHGPALKRKCAAVGVELPAAKDAPATLAELADRPLVALGFAKFGDGRAFSYARLLRTRLQYRGEIRAVGDVLFDEIGYMVRCGFDAFAIDDAPTLRLLRAGRSPIAPLVYQPGLARGEAHVGARPWTAKVAL